MSKADARTAWLLFAIVGVALLCLAGLSACYGNRLDDLEQRLTTHETITIERVAPPEGVSP